MFQWADFLSLAAKVKGKLLEPLGVALKVFTGEFVRQCERGSMDLEMGTQFLLEASWLLKAKVERLLPAHVQGIEEPVDEDEPAFLAGDQDEASASRLFVEKAAGIVGSLISSGQWALPRGMREPDEAPRIAFDSQGFWQACERVRKRVRPIEFTSEEGVWRRLFREIARKLFGLRGIITFSELVGGSTDRRRTVAGLLVVLELGRRRRVSLVQNESFGDIVIARRKFQARGSE